MLVMLMSIPAFSAKYLVQLGSPGAASWRAAIEGETPVDLTVAATDFDSWYNGVTFASGDEVWIAGGIYVINAQIVLKNGVSLYGGFAGTETGVGQRAKGAKAWDFNNETVIDANLGNFGVFPVLTYTIVAVLDGITVKNMQREATSGNPAIGLFTGTLTVQNCKFQDNKSTRISGTAIMTAGLIVRAGVTVQNCYFKNNQMADWEGGNGNVRGGAISVAGDAIVKNCTFEDNFAKGGGGAVSIYSHGAAPYVCGGYFENCSFINNNGGTMNGGGAVVFFSLAIDPSTTTFKNCTFSGNQAATGGAICLTQGNTTGQTLMRIEDCIFENNTANTGAGGALWLTPGTPANHTVEYIKNTIFRGNKTATSGQNGAALVTTRPFQMSNCVFANNSGSNIVFLNVNDMIVYNSTFVKNASQVGGGALVINNVTAIFKNNIFWGNLEANVLPGTGTLTSGNNAFDRDESAQAWYGTGSINTLTQSNTFVSPTSFVGNPLSPAEINESAAANWSLKAGSPAIDAGADLQTEVPTDLAGIARPVGSGFDIGAYEYSAPTGIRKNNPIKSSVYPSITHGILMIESAIEIQSIRMYDLTGKMVQEWTRTNSIDISAHNAGIYIIQVQGQKGNPSSHKIFKK